jgi:hypothetical protein
MDDRRKNALFYRTLNGAEVGDLFMSLIHTCQLCGANSFDYLIELQRHARKLATNPAEWMPWNYRETLERIVSLRYEETQERPYPGGPNPQRGHHGREWEEQVMGWYHYLEDKIRFPFSGQVHRQSRFPAPEGGNRRSPAYGT